jgi:site-specific DNA-methyltransferase (adenine-specific)
VIELNRIYNEDCLEFMRGLEPNSIDMIFTDPPYGHNNNNNGDMASHREAIYEGKKEAYVPEMDWRPIANDGPEANELVRECMVEWERILKPGSCCCCCGGGGGPDPQFARWSLWIDEAFKGGFKQMVVWDKGPMGMGHHYRRSYETILVAQKKGAACKWYDTTKRIENVVRPGAYGIGKIIPQAHHHPTEKPVELAALFVNLHSQAGDVVFDPFLGSGSTAIAALKYGRNFIGCEVESRYVEMATKKIIDFQSQSTLY